jgi:glycosyltransferase involved in cell wall biosynthesis
VQDERYFRDAIEPHVDGIRVSYVGPVDPVRRNALLGGALALVHLIDFDEPFGLTVIEAFATGTPVIATPRGSMPELITDSMTGFLVDDVSAAVVAVGRLAEIDRARCRADAVARFSARRMIDDYLALFRLVLSARTATQSGSGKAIGSPGLFSHAGR